MFVSAAIAALVLTVWQVRVDRSVFERFIGAAHPVVVMALAGVVGTIVMGALQQRSDFAVLGPGSSSDAARFIAWTVPLFAAASIGADLVVRFAEDVNVAMPDALRFYPAIAVFVEIVLHLIPIAVLVVLLGAPTGSNPTLWRIAVPVALIESVLQAGYATNAATTVFSAVQLLVFGVAQVWVFWRFGFVWMLGFRLAYYVLWHLVWGVVRLDLLFGSS
jgi:hypothetical protein